MDAGRKGETGMSGEAGKGGRFAWRGGRKEGRERRTEMEHTHDHADDTGDDTGKAKARAPGVLEGEESGLLWVVLEEVDEASDSQDAAA